jgi:crotonobetainyl-CoA:carnitine CoA-transferase CaiB-like acyl-CoA transferase
VSRAPAQSRRSNEEIAPLDGVRILALEQMQALPFATQLLARLGAEVVKVEPLAGELGRASLPDMGDPLGRRIGATFLRNNLGKRSVCIDLKAPEGRDLVLRMAPRFDVFVENYKPGSMGRLGLSFRDVAAVHPACIYVSISGFGNGASPYRDWPAFAPVVEAMSGIYEMKRTQDDPPTVSPVGALADIGAGLFATVGILAALRQRDANGQGQYVDLAMFDSVVSMTDIVANFWSMGTPDGASGPVINHGFRASDGWFVVQVGREHHFLRLAEVIGRPEWKDDPRFSTRHGWMEHLESEIRPAIERWSRKRSKMDVCETLGAAGIAAGPCLRPDELVADPHIKSHHMLTEIERPDGVEQPVLVPGNPLKLRGAEQMSARIPWLGEHTDDVLKQELGLTEHDIAWLREEAIVG